VTILVPMQPEIFISYKDAAIHTYADESVAAGRWPKKDALVLSKASFETLLPKGLETANHYIYEIQDENIDKTVGTLWFGVFGEEGMQSAFVCDIEVKSEFRRQGYAKAAFRQLEEIVRRLGLTRIGLHVFSHNPGAQALYASLGYSVTSVNMSKTLLKSAT